MDELQQENDELKQEIESLYQQTQEYWEYIIYLEQELKNKNPDIPQKAPQTLKKAIPSPPKKRLPSLPKERPANPILDPLPLSKDSINENQVNNQTTNNTKNSSINNISTKSIEKILRSPPTSPRKIGDPVPKVVKPLPSPIPSPNQTDKNLKTIQTLPSFKKKIFPMNHASVHTSSSSTKFATIGDRPRKPLSIPPPDELFEKYLKLKNQDENQNFDVTRHSLPDLSKVKNPDLSKVKSEPIDYRKQILQEIISTEEAYVKNLSLTVGTFLQPLKQMQDTDERILSSNEIDLIFSNINEILDINLNFLEKMIQRSKEWETTKEMMIGDLILEFSPQIVSIYAQYSRSRPLAIKTLIKCQKRSSFEKYLEEMKVVVDFLTLEALLITPCQRIPRYELLLLDLKKHSVKEHNDFKNIEKCISELQGVGRAMNNALDEYARREKVSEIASTFSETILKELLQGDKLANEARHFIKQGQLTKVCRKTTKKREFFLFDDILLYAKKDSVSSKYVAHNVLQLEKCRIISEEVSNKNQFRIDSDKKSVVLVASSEKEKVEWTKILNETVSKKIEQSQGTLSESATFAPVWKPDSESKRCEICTKSFTLTFRRHHCRLCGKIVCENCSKTRIHLPQIDSKSKSRICNQCKDSKDQTK